jgi:hypothetical protein
MKTTLILLATAVAAAAVCAPGASADTWTISGSVEN